MRRLPPDRATGIGVMWKGQDHRQEIWKEGPVRTAGMGVTREDQMRDGQQGGTRWLQSSARTVRNHHQPGAAALKGWLVPGLWTSSNTGEPDRNADVQAPPESLIQTDRITPAGGGA